MAPPTSEVDVLVVGAGPAGLMLALWMARLGVKTRIVDKRSTKVFSGQADGSLCPSIQLSTTMILIGDLYQGADSRRGHLRYSIASASRTEFGRRRITC